MKKQTAHLILLTVSAILFISQGCVSTKPSRFFLLSATTGPGRTKLQALPEKNGNIAIAVGPVTVPEYLRRPHMVTRKGPNELVINEFARWAEPLNINISRVISENLSVFLNSDDVYIYKTTAPQNVDYRIRIDFTRFETSTEDDTVLAVNWSILDSDGRPAASGKDIITGEKKYSGEEIENIVDEMSTGLEKLSAFFAGEIKKLQGDT